MTYKSSQMKFMSEPGPAAPFSTTPYSSPNTPSQRQDTPALFNVHTASADFLTARTNNS